MIFLKNPLPIFVTLKAPRSDFGCTVCDKDFKSKAGLNRHSVVHEKVTRLTRCGVCMRGFETSKLKLEHILTDHCSSTGNKFECKSCNKTFDTLALCVGHSKKHFRCKPVSTKTKPKQICDICGASLQDQKGLKAHLKLHQSKKLEKASPEKCLLCDKAYRNLSKHNREAHNENDGKNYQCDLCSKYFRHKRGLDYHKMYHQNRKPFGCQFCDRSFIAKTFLNTHLRSHPESGVEAFKCDFCHKQFTRNVVYREHRNRHLGIFPAKCQFCGKCFSGNRSLGQHKTLCHSEEFV